MTMVRGMKVLASFWFDVLFRIVLAVLFVKLETAEPFNRKIHENELWLYRNPMMESYVPTTILWPLVFITPAVVIFITFLINKDRTDFCQANLSVSLALGLNGVLTDIIKLIVGRPRPDFYWRCFPDGRGNTAFDCTGDPNIIRDGRKSFPSGHSSFAFASFGFVALYSAGKLHTFGIAGKTQTWKLFIFICTMSTALAIALSRTCDYHHHWQDVAVGSAIGISITYLCYRHYYPPLDSQFCHKPYTTVLRQIQSDREKKPIREKDDQIKWI
ncbi:phospholipid phosphatase 5 [Venturia canescens]|uniref:phospholipid phosphatase 5 n=1 Tax=Venturia canescens TaxID=32260 RepID=UPI001C9C8860|nr:phospholipid phosphatase 5 [Venturia canescens]